MRNRKIQAGSFSQMRLRQQLHAAIRVFPHQLFRLIGGPIRHHDDLHQLRVVIEGQ
jgi:hypothetical protein